MAGKRKKEKLPPNTMLVNFVDGPKKGKQERIIKPPPKRARYAWPEWCTYEFSPPNEMHYIGDVEIPRTDGMTIEYYDGPLDALS